MEVGGEVGKGVTRNWKKFWPYLCGILFKSFANLPLLRDRYVFQKWFTILKKVALSEHTVLKVGLNHWTKCFMSREHFLTMRTGLKKLSWAVADLVCRVCKANLTWLSWVVATIERKTERKKRQKERKDRKKEKTERKKARMLALAKRILLFLFLLPFLGSEYPIQSLD